ncbi:MAG: DUF3800 domain-containing protein [Anaerolineales bacterium]|nr:DUF3800 domain-containing protein [Anaerolineales bacterium]
MITFTFAGDESGDFSFKFEKARRVMWSLPSLPLPTRRSKQEALIQIADLVAGSILVRDM